MVFKLVFLVSLLIGTSFGADDENLSFVYNGFRSTANNLSLDGLAKVTSNGLLHLTNYTKQRTGHAFYNNPVTFKNSTTNGSTVFSFSTAFVFAIRSEIPKLSSHGIAFFIAPTRSLPGAQPSQYLGLFNSSNDGNSTNRIFAVELDTIQNTDLLEKDGNHLGIDINGLQSEKAAPAGYFVDHSNGKFNNLTLISGQPMQVWVEYDGMKRQIDVTIAPLHVDKPLTPLLSLSRDLSPILNNVMYIGFSSCTSSIVASHYVLGWSFKMNGQAEKLDLSRLPKLPRPKTRSKFLTIGLPIISVILILAVVSSVGFLIRRKRKFAEVLEDWELDYGPHRFKFKDLYIATKGFKDKELLGSGGFGRVYRGVLSTSKLEIAVKRVSHESRQGMREFIAEIVSIGHLRHRNLVQLLGYCRRKGELLLVYDYMPNGSLDKYLYDQPKVTLNWSQRFRVIKGVALGLVYLHEEWEQVVIHRDIKASNILLDDDLNGRLGDFGLARLYDHGTDPQTTHIVGTLGYLAPEHARSGKATTSTDVYAFGAFLLEVASGRRPIEPKEDSILVDWVFAFWYRGEILEARDPNLGTEYVAEELELVMKLGLMCSHLEPSARPTMRQVVQYLERNIQLPELSGLSLSVGGLTFEPREGFTDIHMSYSSSIDKSFNRASSVAESLLSGGR